MAQSLTSLIQGFLRFFFQHLYTDLAYLYDTVAWSSSMGQWRQWQSAMLIDFRPGIILELGHGPGYGQLDLNRAGQTTFALDPSPQMNRLAKRRLRNSGYRADILCGRAQSLPFRNGSFSGVVSSFPSEYIMDPETLQETWRVLQPGGSLTIVGIVEITGKSLPDRFANWLYNITGQSGSIPEHWVEIFRKYRFSPRLEQVQMARARVTRVVAVRASTDHAVDP